MRKKIVYKFIGKVLIGFSSLFVFPILIALIYKNSVIPFLIPQLVSLLLGLILNRIKVNDGSLFAKDGLLIVSLSWIIISLIGSLPFIISGLCDPVDAFFETVSGFTTTGATIFSDVEKLSKSILFWRSFTHFIGGMGVLAFVMAIIPLSSKDKSMHLLKAEMPGPSVGKLVPSIKKTLFYLYFIYLALTFIEFILLLIGGCSVFDSLLISFSTAGTGGFSLLNSSIATYSLFNKIVIGIFMFLFGVNFNIYFLIMMKNGKHILKSEELRVYFFLFITSIIIVFFNTYNLFLSAFDGLLEAFFHVSSIMSSTGFSIGDINIYPTSSRIILLMLMLISACAGSTCGGFKISRLIIAYKSIKRGFIKIIYPNSVDTIKFEGKKVPEDTVRNNNKFLILYIILIVFIMFIVSFDGFSLETTINAVFTTFANVGLCFEISNFSLFSDLSKVLLSVGMLFGRLEIFPMLALFIDLRKK